MRSDNNRLLFYHDETTINLGGSVHALWALKGKKKFIHSSGSKNRLIISGVVNALTGETLLNTSIKMDSDDFIDFLILLLAHYPDKLIDLVVDNASWHKSKVVKEFLNENSRITLYYLPPYAPELNPIEKYWNILKHSITKNKYYKKIKDLKFEIERFGMISNENKEMVMSRIGLLH